MRAQHFLAGMRRLKGEHKHIFGLGLLAGCAKQSKEKSLELQGRVSKTTNVFCSFVTVYGGTAERADTSFSITQFIIIDAEVSVTANTPAGLTATAKRVQKNI